MLLLYIGLVASHALLVCCQCSQYCLPPAPRTSSDVEKYGGIPNDLTACDGITGECLYGCVDGMAAPFCNVTCSINCTRCSVHRDKSRTMCEVCSGNNYIHDGRCRSCSAACVTPPTPPPPPPPPSSSSSSSSPLSTSSSSSSLSSPPSSACFMNNGTCRHGCVTGWFSHTCDRPCRAHCRTASCNRQTGACLRRAVRKRSIITSQTCSPKCVSRSCDLSDGVCTYGCIGGFFGLKCEYGCNSNCIGSKCERLSGSCSLGCKSYFQGFRCNQRNERVGWKSIVFISVTVAIVMFTAVLVNRHIVGKCIWRNQDEEPILNHPENPSGKIQDYEDLDEKARAKNLDVYMSLKTSKNADRDVGKKSVRGHTEQDVSGNTSKSEEDYEDLDEDVRNENAHGYTSLTTFKIARHDNSPTTGSSGPGTSDNSSRGLELYENLNARDKKVDERQCKTSEMSGIPTNSKEKPTLEYENVLLSRDQETHV